MKISKEIKSGILISIITAIITTFLSIFGQTFINSKQNNYVEAQSISQNKHNILIDFIQTTSEFELLRKRAYENQYYSVIWSKFNKELKNDTTSTFFNSTVAEQRELRFKYEESASKLKGLIELIKIYYDKESIPSLLPFEISFLNGFGLDSEALEEYYDQLLVTENDSELFIEKLHQKAENEYNNDFYNNSLLVYNEMKKILYIK